MIDEVKDLGIDLQCNTEITKVSPEQQTLTLRDGSSISYGHVVNASGLHADEVSHLFSIGKQYTLLPFKGIYWKLDPQAGFNIHHLIYPVPDLRVPFLGVHTTTTTDGVTYLGPTAVPAFGRENYSGLQGVTTPELIRITGHLGKQFIGGRDGFRRLAWQEGRRYFKPWFVRAAKAILPRLKSEHLIATSKVGIRAQILDKKTGNMVNDFLVERGLHSTHILNAISPAWTSAFPFARYVCDNYIQRGS
jgi:L-2-hydroxyglutarate oxidase LhgO